ncbi:hypothetical protein DL764_000031 [Monosporascus ibericus]|uniref:Rhodopsin domain-containing protein n=1 Tax=Monosporascus ibericus TaxID=155417 RepID=A0A4Q4TX93_9PEZI|nr:hypothetical protein DL764_000031 [Monosporascus ibericus]
MTGSSDSFNSLSPDRQRELLDGPAAHPPLGLMPNFDNPPHRNHLAFAVTTTGLALSSFMVLLWLVSKLFYQKKVHIGDVFIFAGFGVFVGYNYCLYYWINLTGMYVHTWDIRLRTMPNFLYVRVITRIYSRNITDESQNIYVGSNLYGSMLMSIKIGILMEWARIFVPTGVRNTFWWTCYATLVANVLFYVSAKFVTNFTCIPREKIWHRELEGHCINERAATFASTIVNCVSDLVILAVPHSIIWRLNMSRARKIGVAGIFAVGIFGCVAAVFRVLTCAKYYRSTDFAYDLSPVKVAGLRSPSIVGKVVDQHIQERQCGRVKVVSDSKEECKLVRA